MRWIIGDASLTAIRNTDPHIAQEFFNQAGCFVIGPRVPVGWQASPLLNFTSYETFAANKALATQWVQYDIEKWSLTPALEQQHPTAFMSAFVTLAHSQQQQCVLNPARDLMAVAGADCIQGPSETTDAAYLRCCIPKAAVTADIFVCQSQADQSDIHSYMSLLTGSKAQTGAIPFFGGLTTLRGNPVSELVAAYEAAETTVDGFVLNTNPATIQVACDFLAQIG
jgi:hypothetical protein